MIKIPAQVKHFIPFTILVLATLSAYFFGIKKYIPAELHLYHQVITDFTRDHFFLASMLFILIYALGVSLSLPVVLVFSIIGGYLFPQPWSTLYVMVAGTLGAVTVFAIVKYAFNDILYRKAASYLVHFQKGFEKNEVSYLLFLRLLPLFPFWVTNLAAALLKVPFRTFFWTTVVGIIPGSFAHTQLGKGMKVLLESGKEITFKNLFNTNVTIALCILAVLALIPIFLKKWLRHDR